MKAAGLLAAAATILTSSAAPGQPLGVLPPGPPECGAPAAAVWTNGASMPTVDLGVVSSPIVVSGAAPYLWDVGVLTELTHSRSSDLFVTLTSPVGTVVTLTSGNGGTSADVFDGTIWDDRAKPAGQVP